MTYGELLASLARLSLRSDLTADWPGFVRRAHDVLTDRVTLTVALTATAGAATLPVDLAQVLAVWINGAPMAFRVEDDEIEVPGQFNGPINIVYRPAKTFFTGDGDTNTVLTDYPWAYQYGALAEAYRFLKDQERFATNEAAFLAEIARITTASTNTAAGLIRPRANVA